MTSQDDNYLEELRLFLEENCCDLCRFEHVQQEGVAPELVSISQEVRLADPGSFADIQVRVPGRRPYFVEVKYGYPPEKVARHLARKYTSQTAVTLEAEKIIVVGGAELKQHWTSVESELRGCLRPDLKLELWDEKYLLKLIRDRFDLEIESLAAENLIEIRLAVDRVKGAYAFGDSYSNDPLQSSLLWHFSFWMLRRIRDAQKVSERNILPPGLYKNVAVVYADLSCFSSYVRDTRDDRVMQNVLTSFYSKSRYQIINAGGMLYQFLGDGIIALFGVLERQPDDVERALECGRALLDIGNSVSNEWQRRIDSVQSTGGCHIGIAIGDLHLMPLRPFSRTHMGAIAESINTAARLCSAATAGEIVVSNSFFGKLCDEAQLGFAEMHPVEARNIGLLRAWKLPQAPHV